MKIGFIGLGNMAGAMIGGLLNKGLVSADDIYGVDINAEMAKKRAEEFKIHAGTDSIAVVSNVDYLVLAVKPQFAKGAIEGFKSALKKEQVIISIMAGKTLAWLEAELGSDKKIVRCMPNTPALVGEGITGATPNALVSEEEKETVLSILRSCGRANVVAENLMDAVVGVGGSSPAYVFMFIEAMADGAVEEGMPRALAYEWAAQTVLGSAKLMLETGKHPGELKDMVCSPAGTTIAAVRVLEEAGFRGIVMDAVEAAAERSKEL